MKKILLTTLLLGIYIVLGVGALKVSAAPPNFDKDFTSHLTKSNANIKVFSGGMVDTNKDLETNIRNLFYPDAMNSGVLAEVMKALAIGIILIYIVFAGVQLVTHGRDPEELKKALQNLGYITMGAILIYGAGRLFGDVLVLSKIQGIGGVSGALVDGNRSLFFQLLTFLKGLAFFYAILMIVVTGFRVISAADADKSKKLIRGVLNVIGALVIMKVVDFVYYIAGSQNFAAEATILILSAAKFFGYLYGAAAVLMVFYAGYSFLTDGGWGDGFKRAKNILINILVSGLVLFGFLLILYQIFAEFS